MHLLTISNLYPWPAQPQRGLFNAQQFRAVAEELARSEQAAERGPDRNSPPPRLPSSAVRRQSSVVNLCLVPEWRLWKWPVIRAWKDPFAPGEGTRYLPVFYLPVIGRNMAWRFYASALAAQAACFRAADAVLATWLYPDGVAAADVAARTGTPLWIKAHGSDRFHLRVGPRRDRILAACRSAVGVITVSRPLADELAAAGLDPARLHVVPNGVDTERFQFRPREAGRAALLKRGVPSHWLGAASARLVLFVGNLVDVKGPDLLLEAWRRLTTEYGLRTTDHRLLLAGDGPMRRSIEKGVRRLGLCDSVFVLGFRPHEEISFWMNAADCLCLPSRSEGMPNVVLEALASGLPVVATDVGACREMLAGEPAARVVALEPGGAELSARLAGALNAALGADVDRSSLADRNARRWSWQASARQLLGLLTGGPATGRT